MNLKRQLLLVSLLTLVLPWAGCEFIRETESALRSGQAQMLSGTARAVAESVSRYAAEFPGDPGATHLFGDQVYGHRLERAAEIDGYFEDWALPEASLRVIRGPDGPVRFAAGLHAQWVYFYVEITDRSVVYAPPSGIASTGDRRYADHVSLVSVTPPGNPETFVFAAEAPGPLVTYVRTAFGISPEPTVLARWQDAPGGYRVEARIPANLLGTHIGVSVVNTADERDAGVRSASFFAAAPGPFVTVSAQLSEFVETLAQPGMRMIVTDRNGWRLATTGSPVLPPERQQDPVAGWQRIAYETLLEAGTEPRFAEPDPSGREQQPYVVTALGGRAGESWFRSPESGRAIVAVAEPVRSGDATIGAVILQQGTDAILSLTNQGLTRLMNVTLIATILVAGSLLGYATWLSRRIRHLSVAAERVLEEDDLRAELPSSGSGDEVGDLSRSFSSVLRQLADYNDYLRTLASKLSHELRTPLAIVTSSLDNLEHEQLGDAAAGYTSRAKDGADRLRRILAAMSEASRVEELMQNVEFEDFELARVLESTVDAYRDVYRDRRFAFDCTAAGIRTRGSPELVIQMLDKLVDNAVDFSHPGDTIRIGLGSADPWLVLSVENPGPPLPERMRSQLFDSMVSVRGGSDDRHLGLGLYVAKLIADGHGGRISAANIDGGVRFTVRLPQSQL